MRWIIIAGLLLASLAQAEKLPESEIQKLAPKVKAGCMRVPVSAEFTKELRDDACGCSERNYAAKVRVAEFSSLSRPVKEDFELLKVLEEKAVAECVIPPMQRKLEESTLADCLGAPKAMLPKHKFAPAKVKLVCTCAAGRYSKTVDLLEAGRAKDKDAVADKMAALWLESVEACVANKP